LHRFQSLPTISCVVIRNGDSEKAAAASGRRL
jgi:hypothetical protein